MEIKISGEDAARLMRLVESIETTSDESWKAQYADELSLKVRIAIEKSLDNNGGWNEFNKL